jgi:hypothetical protein
MGSAPFFRLQRVSGQRFENQVVHLDGIRYEDCQFINYHLVYRGGPGEMYSCLIAPDTVWQFDGPAAITLQALQGYGWRFEFGTGPNPEPIRFPSDAL